MRIFVSFLAILGLFMCSGCLAASAVSATAGAVGTTVGVAGDIAEGAVKVALPGDGDDEDDGED